MGPERGLDITLRTAGVDDVAAVLALWEAADAVPSVTDTAEVVERLVTEHEALVVAVAGGVVVGTVIAGWDGWRGNLSRLAVHPDMRRRGLGTRLVREAECRLKERGAVRITALVVAEESHAQAFWSALGYDADLRIIRYVSTLE